jgi:putative restriction endonuclease
MPVWGPERDAAARIAAMAYINRITEQSGGAITRDQLEAFTFEGHRIKLIDQSRGIRNPAMLPTTLSILTNPRSGYQDQIGPDGFPRYSIRTGDWAQGDNRKLDEAYESEVPIIWLQTISPGRFAAVTPVYLIAADARAGNYRMAIGEELRSAFRSASPLEAAYAEAITRRRLHQPTFRLRVMDAYAERCAICSLGHPQLLDTAHIIPDRDERGTPTISNGISLCKIHHTAFDANIIGIRPDYVVQVSQPLLDEIDGPMLQHGLQAFHGQGLRELPKKLTHRPDSDRLDERYQEFLQAG